MPARPFHGSRTAHRARAIVYERPVRYVARAAVALERLDREGDGLVVHQLKRPFRDGTTEFLFEPLDFLARMAALVPRPRSHSFRFLGLVAPNTRLDDLGESATYSLTFAAHDS